MKDVLESLSSFPKLVVGTIASFTGAITGATTTPSLQNIVWIASIFAALATGALAVVRIYLEVKKAKKEKTL